MAKEKKGFILYCDIIHTIEKLSDEQAGKLFKHILKYVNDQDPIAEDIITEIAFEPIKQTLKRDLQKYEDIRIKNQENARKRWNATASERMQMDTKNAVIDKDIVKVKDKVIESIDERKLKFAYALEPFLNEYGKDMLNDFYSYWTEHGEKDKKLRFEKEKTFGIQQRLKNWHSRNPKQYQKQETDHLVEYVNKQLGL